MTNKITIVVCVMLACCSCERQMPNNVYKRQYHSTHNNMRPPMQKRTTVETLDGFSSKVRIKKESGVFKVPISINGCSMEFIFDTGASDIVISSLEATFLYKQGKLQDNDILDEEYYQIADGSIAVGTIINLREVRIANKVLHNVKATVVENIEAPLLLGQSALARFGKISIDYKNQIIEFQ